MKVERGCQETVVAEAPRCEAGREDFTEPENQQDDANTAGQKSSG